jgi:hypothetical protein
VDERATKTQRIPCKCDVRSIRGADGGFRDMNKTYTNYFLGETGYGLSANSDFFVKTVNKQKLCGAANWRLPTADELMTLVKCSDGKYNNYILGTGSCTNPFSISKPTINSTYFPNTLSMSYWSSSLSPYDSNQSSHVDFSSGYIDVFNYRNSLDFVRLVR